MRHALNAAFVAVADGANSEGEDEVEDEKHSEGPRPRRAAARAPRATRSSSRETRQRKLNAGDPPDVQDSPPNRSSREARSRKPHTDSAPPVEAPQPNQPPAGVSQKAAGKRKAGSTSSTSASAQSLQAHHLGLKKSIEEHIEYEFRNHVRELNCGFVDRMSLTGHHSLPLVRLALPTTSLAESISSGSQPARVVRRRRSDVPSRSDIQRTTTSLATLDSCITR